MRRTKPLVALLAVLTVGLMPFAQGQGTLVPQTGWTLHFVDSEETAGEDGAATNAFDGDTGTFWHSEWQAAQPPNPHEIQINLGASHTLTGFSYLPRQSGSVNGTIDEFEFYVSTDGTNWGTAVATGTWPNSIDEKVETFPATTGQYIRLVSISEVNDAEWTSVVELNVYETAGGGGGNVGGNIIFVSGTAATNDITNIQPILTDAGYTVTRVTWDDDANPPNIAEANAADLVIFSREANSGQFDTNPAVWNSIETPIINLSTYMARNNRLFWVESATINNNLAGDALLNVPTHPIFTGLTIPGNNQVPLVTDVDDFMAPGVTAGNGTILASRADDPTQLWIAYWPAGTEFYTGAGHTATGSRLLMSMFGPSDGGTGNVDGVDNLTTEGRQVFLNAVEWMIYGNVGGGEGEGEGEVEPQGNEIWSNVYPPYIDEGSTVILTAPPGSGWQWSKDGTPVGGATDRELIFNPVTNGDAGAYAVSYTDTESAAQTTPTFNLSVGAEGTVPVAGGLGLAALMGACALAGAGLIRRRK